MSYLKKFLAAEKKKCGENGATAAIIVALITAFSGTGFIFGIFDFGDRGQSGGSYFPRSHPGFITEKTRIPIADLNGSWRFQTGDDLAWAQPDFDDSSWQSITVPSPWEKKGAKDYDGFAWYRRSFSVDSDSKGKPIYAFLGQIDDVDEVFINGKRIGGMGTFPPRFTTAWNLDRVYRVPNEVLQTEDENIISVRVYDDRLGGGIHRGDIGLFTTELVQPLVYLDGPWKFKAGDDPAWKDLDFDDQAFDRIHVPHAWDLEGYENYDGYAWYRKSFGPLPASNTDELVLLLGKIDDTDEVFLNGELIGSTGAGSSKNDSNYSSYHRALREYTLPQSALRSRNQISVRVHDSGGHGGIYSGPVSIMTKTSYERLKAQLEESEKWTFSKTVDWLLGRD